MGVNLELIKGRYYYRADDDGEMTFTDGEPIGTFGPCMYAYEIAPNGVLTVWKNYYFNDSRLSFESVDFGPNAWASAFGTRQSEIEEMEDDEFVEDLRASGRIWSEVMEDSH